VEEHLSTGTEVHHEEQLSLWLEWPVKLNNEWMI
jgi:hypothetical protein